LHADVKVFAIWEPILATDWGKPGSGVLRRFSDGRVSQFWDRQHLVAKRMALDARSPQPKQQCCQRAVILWDLGAVYRPGALWTGTMPPAAFFDGPVVHVKLDLASKI
jgi:hypothetical protein